MLGTRKYLTPKKKLILQKGTTSFIGYVSDTNSGTKLKISPGVIVTGAKLSMSQITSRCEYLNQRINGFIKIYYDPNRFSKKGSF